MKAWLRPLGQGTVLCLLGILYPINTNPAAVAAGLFLSCDISVFVNCQRKTQEDGSPIITARHQVNSVLILVFLLSSELYIRFTVR